MLSRRKFLTVTAGCVVGSALVSACTMPSAAPSGSKEEGAAPEAATVVYWALQGENGDNNLVRGVITPFEEKYPDVKIDLQEIPEYVNSFETVSAKF